LHEDHSPTAPVVAPFLAWLEPVAIRDFTDATGVRWRVWAVVPSNPSSVTDELREGWLSFDSDTERRRVAPIPKDWESLPPDRLELLCRIATPGRRSDPSGFPRLPDDETP
jgi:hypothetical protein